MLLFTAITDEHGMPTCTIHRLLIKTHVLHTQVFQGSRWIQRAAARRQPLPVHCTAIGGVFMADQPVDQVHEILNSRVKQVPHRTQLILAEYYKKVRRNSCKRGFMNSKLEYQEDINSVATPIRPPDQATGEFTCPVLAAPTVNLIRTR